MLRNLNQKIYVERLKCEKYQTRILYLNPVGMLREKQQRLADYEEKIRMLMSLRIKEKRHALMLRVEQMKRVSPREKIKQGFSFVQNESGNAVKSVADVKLKEKITIFVTDGQIDAEVIHIQKESYHGNEE